MDRVVQLPLEQAHPLQVAPALYELLANGALHRVRTAVGDPAWLVTTHAQVCRLLADDRLGRTHPEPHTTARMGESALYGGPLHNFATEHIDHARWRALLQPHFSPKHMHALRPRVDNLTTGLLDQMVTGGAPADLHAAVALPLPILVICELLGVPYEDREMFRTWTTDAANTRDRVRSEKGLSLLARYGRELVAAKRRRPADDVISRLCLTEGLSDSQIADLSMGLLWAGYETTVAQIGLSSLLLLANPDQWRILAADPAMVCNAVEETLRASRRGGGVLPRYARTDLQIDGVTIKTGDLVLLGIAAANHDPSVFADPGRVDITRPAPGHLTFGHGARYCLGAPLARIELYAVLSQLASRFPTMRLAADPRELTLRTGMLFGGLNELPVRW